MNNKRRQLLLDAYKVTNEWEPITLFAGIPMLLWCPGCGKRHIDTGEFVTKIHHTHVCQYCGMVWRPALEPTVGVQFLPGYKDE